MAEERHFCTLFDSNYVPHALSLYDSLVRHLPEAHLFMFCMDDNSLELLSGMALPNATVIGYQQLEDRIPGLRASKESRSRVEYFYTCTPATCLYSLQEYPDIDSITYLDADLFFFASPEPVFDELEGHSIGIIEHRFRTDQPWHRRVIGALRDRSPGRFNVGWITFRNDEVGRQCATDWTNDCIAWCFQRFEKGLYADQKYLDYWPDRYEGLRIVEHLGANVARWNVAQYQVGVSDEAVTINGQDLLFYHFAGLEQIGPRTYRSGLSAVGVPTSGVLLERVYRPYAQSLHSHSRPDGSIQSKPPLRRNRPLALAREVVVRRRRARNHDDFSI